MRGGRKGVALFLVLWLVVALGAAGAGVVRATRTAHGVADNARAAVVARAAAESGVEATVAAIEDTLARLAGTAERPDWLNALVARPAPVEGSLGDARFAVAVVDASARLDVNAATEAALGRFFSQFTDPAAAASIARAIRARIDGRGGRAQPLRALESLRAEGLVPDAILRRAAPYLTVDGDGSINQRGASDTVRAAATGELRDDPGRLLIISRGWLSGHPLTHEIQAVYAISGDRLVFSHWRERGR